MQEQNNYFNSQFKFFSQLPPNTDIHYSKNHHSFIVTGGSFSYLPGAQSTANLCKGHSSEILMQDLNQLTIDLYQSLNQRLVSVYNSQFDQEYNTEMAQLQTLEKDFEKAVTGLEEGGGLLGLRVWQDEDVKVKIEQFIQRTRNVIATTQGILQAEKKTRESKGEEVLLESISEIEAEHQFDKFLSPNLLQDITELEKEEVEGKNVSYTKAALYKVSLGYNALMNIATSGWDWWNQISIPKSDANIFLGALPLSRKYPGASEKSSDDLEALTKEHKIGAVLSVVEPFEMNTRGYLNPISANQWRHAGVKHKQLPTEDFKTMSPEVIEEGVEYINECVFQNIPVYIHCKAGRGRSALVLTCYLIKYHGFSAEEAIAHIQKFRPQAKLEKAKMDSAKKYEVDFLFKMANADKKRKLQRTSD